MKHVEWSGLEYLAFPTGVAALLTGLIDDSYAWLGVAAVSFALWLLLLVFSIAPSVYRLTIDWIQEKYEQTSPHSARSIVSILDHVAAESVYERMTKLDAMSDTQFSTALVQATSEFDARELPKASDATIAIGEDARDETRRLLEEVSA